MHDDSRGFYAVPYDLYKDEKERADRLEGEVARLNQLLQNEYIPQLLKANNLLAQQQEELRKIQYERDMEDQRRNREAQLAN